MAAGGISIEIPKAQIERAMKLMDPKQLKMAMRSTVGKATAQGRTIVREEAKEILNVKASTINEAVTSFTKTSGGNPVGIVRVSQKRLGAFDFKGTRVTKRRGVTIKPYKDRPAQKFLHAFAATMKSGHKGVWLRAKKGFADDFAAPKRRKKRGRKKPKIRIFAYVARLPIEEVKPLSVLQVIKKTDVMKRATDKIAAVMTTIFLGQYSRFGLSPSGYAMPVENRRMQGAAA